jgi:hypothetical protein
MTTKEKYNFIKGPVTKEEISKFKNIFDGLEKDPQAYDFLTPVNYIGIISNLTLI